MNSVSRHSARILLVLGLVLVSRGPVPLRAATPPDLDTPPPAPARVEDPGSPASPEGGAGTTSPIPTRPIPSTPRLGELLKGSPPTGVEDLRSLELRVREVAARGLRATVGLRVGNAAGSGVLIADSLVLTAAHVCGAPDQDVTVILHGGERVKGRSLGSDVGLDAGLVRLTDELPEPFREAVLEIAAAEAVDDGQWCLALGHPGGFRRERPAPLRLGRVLDQRTTGVRTDCLLIGGDSGGPLLDLEGRIIGIHSRISPSPRSNIHVPVAAFHRSWDRLVGGETWGGRGGGSGPKVGGPWLGISSDPASPRAKVARVIEDSPAAKAGILPGDVITQIGDEKIENFGALARRVGAGKPGDKLKLRVERGEETLELELVLGTFERR